jgi:hypothetical protein
MDRGIHLSSVGQSPFTDADITRFNEEHDQRHGYTLGDTAGFTRQDPPLARLYGPPDLEKRLPVRELDALVWGHHWKTILKHHHPL